MTGLVIRLAKSAFQGGRDGTSTPSDRFAIAFEGKLYTDKLALERLAGKTVIAGAYLGGRVDIWAICATSEVGDLALADMSEILQERGISLLTLDWAERPLPPLAVLLAAARQQTLDWFKHHKPTADVTQLEQQLTAIAADPFFPTQAADMRRALSAAEVGLDALRQRNARWLSERFALPGLSQSAFGQTIAVSQAQAPALPRAHLVDGLADLITADAGEAAVIAVLGEEGVGKTWLAAQWWVAQPDPPILIFVAGRRAELLNAAEPLAGIARLLAHQDGRSDEPAALAAWKRKLTRWKTDAPSDSIRFVILLDGLNERDSEPWADHIRGLTREVRALGGVLMVTARQAYWDRDVAPRIRTSIEVRRLSVDGYTDPELSTLLGRNGRTLEEIPGKVREFIRNPRICALALDLLDRLLLQPEELTVERLLLEYWRWRVADRSQLAHTADDFHKLLRGHARAFLAQPRQTFDRDDWIEFSGAAKRLGVRDVANDLTEIEEGRFMTIAAGGLDRYEFRQEALPFAVGLLINDELKTGLKAGSASAEELLERLLEPVRAFDQIADIVAAAAGLACLDDGFPAEGRQALILSWLRLQNTGDGAFEALSAYVPTRPAAFLDAAELTPAQLGPAAREQSLALLLAYTRNHPRVQMALAQRLPRWLGTWSRISRTRWRDNKDAERQVDRNQSIDDAIAGLTTDELSLVRRLTVEMPAPAAMVLDRTSALLIAARPQVTIAAGLVGWGLARSIAADHPDGRAEMEWAVRLNTKDWVELRDAVCSLLTAVTESSAQDVRTGAAVALRALGDRASARRADALSPRITQAGWRRIETFCATDPYDPGARLPDNLDRARTAVAELDPAQTWQQMSSTGDDHDLEPSLPGLARFDKDVLIRKLRQVVQSGPDRTGLPLRQLAWRLPGLAPLFDAETRAAVQTTFEALANDPTRAPQEDAGWLVGQIAGSLLPGASAEEQLDTLLRLPPRTKLYLNLRRGLVALPADRLEARLEAALAKAPAREDLQRVLLFASGAPAQLTDRVREILVDLVFGSDRFLSVLASDVGTCARDARLDDMLLARLTTSNVALPVGDKAFSMGRLISLAISERGRDDLSGRVPPEFLGRVAGQLGGLALDHLASQTTTVVERLLWPVDAKPPVGVALFHSVTDGGLESTIWSDEIEDEAPDLKDWFSEMADPVGSASRFSRQQKMMIREMTAYRRALTKEGAEAVSSVPSRQGLRALAERDPARVEGWLRAIMEVSDSQLLSQIHNLGVTLAGAIGRFDGALAASVFRKLSGVSPSTNVVLDLTRTPLVVDALFSDPDVAELDGLRYAALEAARHDAELATLVIAAEVHRAGEWLARYVDASLERPEPAWTARALTIAGLRVKNLHSDAILARDWGGGFLGAVAKAAREAYERGAWTETWLSQLCAADDPNDVWRFGQLAEGIADYRSLIDVTWRDAPTITRPFLSEIVERLVKAAEKRQKKREGSLFGQKPPERDLQQLLDDISGS